MKNELKVSTNQTLLGLKFFKRTDEEFIIYRVYGIKQDGKSCFIKTNTGKEFDIDTNTLIHNYVKLIPDGMIGFFIMSIIEPNYTYQDVSVAYYTMKNLERYNRIPSVFLRQNLEDIMYNLLHDKPINTKSDYFGLCVKGDLINDSSIPYEILTKCNKVDSAIIVNTYINDCQDDIMNILQRKKRKLNRVLYENLASYMKAHGIKDTNQESINGMCRNINTLLKENNFFKIVDSTNGICNLSIDINKFIIKKTINDKIYDMINDDLCTILASIFKQNIIGGYITKYNHDIDISEIDGNYSLIRDNEDIVYIIRYITSDGKVPTKELENFFNKFTIYKMGSNFYNKYQD